MAPQSSTHPYPNATTVKLTGSIEHVPEKRPRDDNDYEAGSHYFNSLFHTDWATEKNLSDPDAVMQQRIAQEQAQEEWQANHDRLFGPNKKREGRSAVPEPESPADGPGMTGGPETTDGPETTEEDRRLDEEINKRFNPVVERFRRIESIKRRPAATSNGRKTGEPGKNVTFAAEEPGPDGIPLKKTMRAKLLSPGLQPTNQLSTTSKPTTHETPAERFGPHPTLPRTDQDFEDAICTLKLMMRDWTQTYFFNKLSEAERHDFNLYRLAQGSPELMKHAAWVCAGGSLEKWNSHFVGHRAELVFGVLGRMLEVEVFGHTMFGATAGQLATLTQMDLVLLKVDGFKRTRVRSRMIKTLLDRAIVPPHFDAQVQDLTIRFFTMIAPLIPRSVARTLWIPTNTRRPFLPASTNTPTPPTAHTNPLLSSLWALISHAAKISLDMRREETIYYVSAPAKGSAFEESSMSCMNRKWVKRRGVWREDDEVPVVRVVGFPGIVAYRAGSGREEVGEVERGCRERRVSRAEVVVEWGVERVVGSGVGYGNGDGHKNGNGSGNGDVVLTLKEAIAKSKASASWVYGLLDWITPWGG